MSDPIRFIRWFAELGIDDVPIAGGKNASLGEMYRALTPRGVRVPNGFAVTADAYRDVVTRAGVWTALHELLDPIDGRDVAALAAAGARAHGRASSSTPRRSPRSWSERSRRATPSFGRNMDQSSA